MIQRISSDVENFEYQKKRNIFNFDEQKVRIDCIKRQNILVSENVSKFYAINLENRQFIIIFESINIVNEFPLSLILIIQDQELMKS
jgi:hypothetical protein